MSRDKSGHKRKNLLGMQRVVGGSTGGPTGAVGTGDVDYKKAIPSTTNKMSEQKVAGSEKEVTS